ncbi:hypothetical protein O181_041557 [Austropuccinia psidii MF-1]|uniref:Uncharacterized protein n=1 Tax=Austropuccinia psidii MF-1 TaxID=1389203 RepID=A0A9Q3DL04_9BASI|nr:hypothetical protein [Austropuccinia psidii MF-1]
MKLLGPLWLNSNEAKRGQGGSSEAPKSQVGPPEPVLAPKPNQPKMAKNHLRTQIGHKSAHGLWSPPEATSSAQSKDSPPGHGKTSLSSMHSVLKDQEWCIYRIMYHYAPFFLRNPMVTLSGPNYVIPYQVPNPSPILKEEFSAIQSGNSLAATRRPFKDPNHLALQHLGWGFLKDYSNGNSQS